MNRFKIIPVIFYLLSILDAQAQCPAENVLYKRLIFLRDSSTLAPRIQLKELLDYEVKIKACPDQDDSTHVLLLQRIGATYYKTGDYIRAILFTRKSIDIIAVNPAKPSINYAQIIHNYYNLSIFYDSLNIISEKHAAVDSCIAISLRLKVVDQFTLSTLCKKTDYLFYKEDYERCYSYARIGETLTNRYFGRDKTDYIIYFFTYQINTQFILQNASFTEALLERKVNRLKKNDKSLYGLGTLYELWAQYLVHKGNYDKAYIYFKKALQYNQKAGYELGCSQTLNNLGLLLYFQHYNNRRKALSIYKKALGYLNHKQDDIDEKWEALNSLTNIGNVFGKDGFFYSALYYFQLAFNQIKPGFNENNLIHDSPDSFLMNTNIEYLTELIIDKGNIFLQQFKKNKEESLIKKAIQIYRVDDKLFDKIKSKNFGIQSKLFWRNNAHRLYENAIDACLIENDNDDAFHFFEKSRAVLLNDQLNEQHWMKHDEILEQAQLKKNILQLERELNSTDSNSGNYIKLQNDLITGNKKLDDLLDSIKAHNPLYYQSFLDTTSVTLNEAQSKILDNHDALLEFFEGDRVVYEMIVTKKYSRIIAINKQDFDSTVNSYLSYISDPDFLNRYFNSFTKISQHLYQLIFKDIVLPSGRIIISPDGPNFPFESLVTSAPNKQLSYFLESHPVSYTYSASFLMHQFNSNRAAKAHDFLGVAPIQYPAKYNLPPLRENNSSLQNIKSYFNDANLLVSTKATKRNFLQNFPTYKIIQLYTHASSEGNKDDPVIYFNDSALYLSDLIPENKPVTCLIVLSACQTANGKLYKGEGIFSFNRGFAALGIPTSIANLWKADNESTCNLTELFYKYLASGERLDIALQKAKIEFIHTNSKKESLPYYWANMILIGNTDPIKLVKNSIIPAKFYNNSWIVVLAIIGLSFLVILLRKLRR